MVKYIVTGGLGFIGYHLTKELLRQGHEVIIFDNLYNSEYSQVNEQKLLTEDNPNLLIINIDVLFINEASLDYDFSDVEGIFHLAAVPRVQASFDDVRQTNMINVDGTLSMLDFAVKNNIKRFVFASSSTAKNQLSPYGLQKRLCEKYVNLYNDKGILGISLRYFSVYGPNMDKTSGYALLIPKAIDCAMKGEFFNMYGDGSNMRDFTYIDDVIRATITAMKFSSYGGIFDVGRGDPIKVKDVLRTVSRLTNRKMFINQLPPRVEEKITYSSDDFTELTGWKATISFDEGMNLLIESEKRND